MKGSSIVCFVLLMIGVLADYASRKEACDIAKSRYISHLERFNNVFDRDRNPISTYQQSESLLRYYRDMQAACFYNGGYME
jgi:hypothetical protein